MSQLLLLIAKYPHLPVIFNTMTDGKDSYGIVHVYRADAFVGVPCYDECIVVDLD